MFASGVTLRDTMSQIVSRILRIPVEGKPVTILDLSAIPSEIIDVVVSLLCRVVFDFAVWSKRDESIPVLLVCDEAHRYVPADDAHGFEPTRLAMARIAKEGRKYGVSLCLVSQRPSEISESVLSQCSTVFALRMASERDLKFVRSALPEASSGPHQHLAGFAISGGRRHRRRRDPPDAHPLPRPRGTVPAGERLGELPEGVGNRHAGRGFRRPGRRPLAPPAALTLGC